MEKSNSFKDALQHDFEDIKENSREIGRGSLFVLGVLAAGFLAYKLLGSNSHHEEPDEEGENTKIVYVNNANQGNWVSNSIMRSIALFLLNIAKQKIVDFIQEKSSEQ